MLSDPSFFSMPFCLMRSFSSWPYFLLGFAESSWHAKSHFESTSVKESRGKEQQKGNNLRGGQEATDLPAGEFRTRQKGAKNGEKKKKGKIEENNKENSSHPLYDAYFGFKSARKRVAMKMMEKEE